MAESSIPTFQAFCEHHDGASLSADQKYLDQYKNVVQMYASFASTRSIPKKGSTSAPMVVRWRSVGLEAIKSVAASDSLTSLAGKQLTVLIPVLLENLWTNDMDFLSLVQQRARMEEKVESENLLRRRTSIATVRTAESAEINAAALSGSTADADKLAEEEVAVCALQCLKSIFVVNNRSQIYVATNAVITFIGERVAQNENVLVEDQYDTDFRGWATRIFEMITRWTPVQDRYVILVTAMDVLVRSPMVESNLGQQLVLATMVDSLLKSDINLIGLSVMDVLLGLVQHVLRTLQLSGVSAHPQQNGGFREKNGSDATDLAALKSESVAVPSDTRHELLSRLQDCIGHLATHIYYADQISDMILAILQRLKPTALSPAGDAAVAVDDPVAASTAVTSVGDLSEDSGTDDFFSFDTAKVKALQAIKSIMLVASRRKKMSGAVNLGRNRVPAHVWEGTEWLLRDADWNVRKAYVEAIDTWLDTEKTKTDLRAATEKSKSQSRVRRDDSGTNLNKRAVSNASQRDKSSKPAKSTFIQLLHLAVYDNAIQYADNESDVVLLHILLSKLVEKMGVNAIKDGLPMVFRLQDDVPSLDTSSKQIRVSSLCQGYFLTLSEKFDFDTSPVGRTISNEIKLRRTKKVWTEAIRYPPMPLAEIGQSVANVSPAEIAASPLPITPFEDRFQLVKLISLMYAQTFASPPTSAPSSPGRSFTQSILGGPEPVSTNTEAHALPESFSDQMMFEWSRESVFAAVQESSKTISLNGSKTGTNATAPRNFLAVNGHRNGSGTGSPQRHSHTPHDSKPNSTYGLVGGLGGLSKVRKGSGFSASPTSDDSHASVTRLEQLKRALSGQQGRAISRAHSDASSESMVSYDYTASEVSFNPGNGSAIRNRPSSQRDRSRSKSRDPLEQRRPLTSHPVLASPEASQNRKVSLDVPPVPPIPLSISGVDGVAATDHAQEPRKSRSVKQSTKSRGGHSIQGSTWGAEGGQTSDLKSLLEGIETGSTSQKGDVVSPPY